MVLRFEDERPKDTTNDVLTEYSKSGIVEGEGDNNMTVDELRLYRMTYFVPTYYVIDIWAENVTQAMKEGWAGGELVEEYLPDEMETPVPFEVLDLTEDEEEEEEEVP